MSSDRSHWERITEDLVELKNTSEMMIDLAYSALLLNSSFLAEEVLLLEKNMDELHLAFQTRVLAVTEERTAPEELFGIIRMGNVTERIADAAAGIAEVVIRGEEPHRILEMVIQDAEETVEKATVGETSAVAGKSLAEADIADETGMWVLVIKRENKWIKPSPSTVVLPGDIIIASGYSEGEEDFKQLVSG